MLNETGKATAWLRVMQWLSPAYCLCFAPLTFWAIYEALKRQIEDSVNTVTSVGPQTMDVNTVQKS